LNFEENIQQTDLFRHQEQARSTLSIPTDYRSLGRGAAVDHVITITNDGPAATTGVVLQDKLLSALPMCRFDAASGGTTYDPAGTRLWVVGSLQHRSASQVLTV
jgi:hypothetical protein